MSMADDAAKAARETIAAYVAEIRKGVKDLDLAAGAVAQAGIGVLGGKGIPGFVVPGFAEGTGNAPDMFIAGEDGPELVVGAGGSAVYPADATRGIAAAAGTDRRIAIDINGSGEIDVSGADEEAVWGMVQPRLKAALMGIIKAEIFEEGDRSYAF
jgi:hypothetical protein